ncbi:MAG: putative bifunctional diguanylate cyclase/phosphodiesterase [Leptothrix sp. (in: b-proteobacteria)]
MPDPASAQRHAGDQGQWLGRLVELHYQRSLQASLSGVVLALLVAWVLWPTTPHWALLGWLLVVEAAGLLRSLATLYYQRYGPDRLGLQRWRHITWTGGMVSGIGWGLLGLLYPETSDALHQLVIVFTLMGVCAGSATLVVSLAGMVPLFGVLALGPLIGVMISRGDAAHLYLGVALAYYLWVVMFQGPRRMAESLNNIMAGNQERDALLARLEDAEQMAHVAHFIWDHERQQATLSAEARRLYGVQVDTSIGTHSLWNAVVPDDRRRVINLSGQAVAQQQGELHFETMIESHIGLRDVQVVQRFEYNPAGQVQRSMTTLLDITELKNTQRELHTLAFRDALTGLANRSLFQDRLRKVVAHALRHQHRVGVLMLDLDHFKTVNDTLGHAAGDQLLIQAGERLRQCVRDYDTVARLGGDEFAVVLPDVRRALDVATVAGKIIEAMSAPFRLDENEMFVSASIGIAVCPSDADSADMLMRHADIALFEAKGKGRSNFQFYSADLTQRARERMGLEVDLRHAMPRGELALHYQPKIRIEDGVVVGAEALLRWQHPVRGMVPPDRFIGLAEDTGLIVPIGAWVLRTACAAAHAWNHQRSADDQILKIAVNLSPRQFINHDLVATVRTALTETDCKAEWIELELTESLLLDERGKVQDTLQELRAMGFTLAIDDFGTGYSALGYLTRFPISTLKIDRSFIQDIATKPERASIVRAIISMGHSLQLDLVAEGVETREQAVFLNELGCHLAQGWLYGRPIAQLDFETRHLGTPALTTATEPAPVSGGDLTRA